MPLPLRQRAYNHIRYKLLSGGFPAGSRLSEVALAKETGMSRTPIREAISQLASEGLVERDPQLGVLVKRMSRSDLVELLVLREILETYAAPRAARRITAAQARQLREILDRLRSISRQLRDRGLEHWQGDLGRQLTMTDMAFHLVILEASRQPRMTKIVIDFHLLTTRYRDPSIMSLHRLAAVLLGHWRIYRAIQRHDAAAARSAMRFHARERRAVVLNAFDRQQHEASQPPTVTDWSHLLDQMLGRTESKASNTDS